MGSGWFYTLSDADLANGFFVTAAHCAIMVSGPTYYKMTAGFIENPLTKKWHKIDVNNIYVDGVADIAVINTGINFTDNSAYCLKLAANPLLAGDMCYIVGNPAGIDEDSICVGTVRDPTYCDRLVTSITIQYIKKQTTVPLSKTILFNKLYSDVPNLSDSPLRGGMLERIKNKLMIVKN